MLCMHNILSLPPWPLYYLIFLTLVSFSTSYVNGHTLKRSAFLCVGFTHVWLSFGVLSGEAELIPFLSVAPVFCGCLWRLSAPFYVVEKVLSPSTFSYDCRPRCRKQRRERSSLRNWVEEVPFYGENTVYVHCTEAGRKFLWQWWLIPPRAIQDPSVDREKGGEMSIIHILSMIENWLWKPQEILKKSNNNLWYLYNINELNFNRVCKYWNSLLIDVT